ncbi:MAG TPA: aldehyde dehydrogenase family protein [Patescibacteria group bacterium]|nr:aldehyde dehydrogenase family protein [Patescibacteria group bacterium]
MTERKIFIRGEWRSTGDVYEIRSPHDGVVVTRAHRARPADIEDAIVAARDAFSITRSMPTWKRTAILRGIAEGIGRRREELVNILALEAGKPVKAGRNEVDRAIFTFEVAAEEARRIGAEMFPMDWAPSGADRIGLVKRFPLGPLAAIVPFNFPLNLSAHKIAPAIASGNTMVLKPATQTPSAALVLAEVADAAGLPAGALNVVAATAKNVVPLVIDERFRMLTFTGSAAVGWDLRHRAGKKRVTLELGGNAAAIVHEDADLQRAAERITFGGYSYSGQSCISVQRVLVQRKVQERFMEIFVPMVKALKTGDPLDDSTDIGPMITEQDARRVASWIEEAAAGGARVVLEGVRKGALLTPSIVTDVDPEMRISCQEVFGPVVAISSYDSLDEALATVNRSDFGLQAGIFTRHAPSAWKAFERLDVGGVMVDDVPTFRIDHMPYGGVKDSGAGREGIKYAIEEMTEIKVMGWHIDRN